MTQDDPRPGSGDDVEVPDPMDDPQLRDTAARVRNTLRESVLAGELLPDDVRADLRAALVAARARQLAEGRTDAQPRSGSARTPTVVDLEGRRRGRGPALGWVAAAAAALIAASVVVQHATAGSGAASVRVVALGAAGSGVDPSAPITVDFSQPMDHAATIAALRLSPAATLRSTWQGDALTLTPANGLAPNVSYVLTVDHTVARTAAGSPLAADARVVFGTAPRAEQGSAASPPVALAPQDLAAAADGSEAVVVADGSVILTAARSSAGDAGASGLVRVAASGAVRLSPAVDAICVSRSGQSVAYLSRDRDGQDVVFADALGTPLQRVPVTADASTPLGWIGDQEVSFVSAGRLVAVDRAGRVRVVSPTRVDAARDDVTLSPGGRYVFTATGPSSGLILDLASGRTHPLDGISTAPAFSADGASVVWIEGSGPRARLATGPSAGGLTVLSPLALAPGDTVSDLAVSPDGSRLVYSVIQSTGGSQLRVASLPDGNTVAVWNAGGGQSPNWAPSGTLFTVLADVAGAPRIEEVGVPAPTLRRKASWEGTVRDFATAQVAGDSGAQAALAAPAVVLPPSTDATRWDLLWIRAGPSGTATARVRLSRDATAADPVVRRREETLVLGQASTGQPPSVTAVSLGAETVAPPGPSLVRLDVDTVPGSLLLTFDSDLDPATLGALTLVGPDGATIPATVGYVTATRTVALRPAGGVPPGTVATVQGATGLRDVAGHPLDAPFTLDVRGAD